MKIIILGAGQVGVTLATHLANENNDICVVDTEAKRLKALQSRLDIRTITGYASHPDVLLNAGIEDADLLIAVTNSDEVNMIACQIAYSLFRTPTKIARIRAAQYMLRKDLFDNNATPIDVIICPEQLVMNNIRRLIENPAALQVLDFAEGKVQLVAVKIASGNPLEGHTLRSLNEKIPDVNARIVAIYRQDTSVTPTPDTTIQESDEVFFIAPTDEIPAVMKAMDLNQEPNKRIMIAGGGNIGTRLSSALESKYRVKVIEHNPKRIEVLSLQLNNTIILNGDASDRELLLEENIQDTDIFCATTNLDEANIMSATLAKRLGAKRVLALINRSAYVDVIEGGDIDIAVSPQQATISSLLTHVRKGDVVNVYALRRGAAEAIEAIIHGDKQSSQLVGRQIGELDLPEGASVAAVVRDEEVILPDRNFVLQAEDHMILFIVDKRQLKQIERLFQVGLTFF